jgi:nicotinate-nucleotide adenylyltransferase
VAARIGVFGGSFNPVHVGHLVLAQDALEAGELDEVLFVPCGVPAHKRVLDMAPAEHRVAMLELVTELDEGFAVSRIEVDRPGISYTLDTLDALQRRRPGAELVFVMGSDSLPELHAWSRIEVLLHRYAMLAVVRPGLGLAEVEQMDLRLPPDCRDRLLTRVVRGHGMDISATDIRMRVAEGMRIRYLVPDAVAMYIMEHHLYQ